VPGRYFSKSSSGRVVYNSYHPVVEVAAEIQRRCGAKVAFLGIQPKSLDISLLQSKKCLHAAEEIADIIHRITTTLP